MARTFTAITGQGAGGAFELNSKWGYETCEELRQDVDLLAYNGNAYPLGGDDTGILSASYTPVNGWLPHLIDGDQLGGMTVDLVAVLRTANAATSVTVRLQRADDAAFTTNVTTVATGSASTAVTDTVEVTSITLASGAKWYRLMVIGSNTTHGVYARGYLRIRKVPA